MTKKSKSSGINLADFQKSQPRIVVPNKKNEADARLYTKKGRLILTPAILKHFNVERQLKTQLLYELYFDHGNKLIAVKFLKKKTSDSYIASEAKGSRFIELKGPCKRQELKIEEKLEPVIIKIYKDPNDEDLLYFSYGDFARSDSNY